MSTMKVQLVSGRVGHRTDEKGRFLGEFAQSAGQIVEMPKDEAERYLDRGLATLPTNKDTK